jgi:hypothetical protein
VVDTLYYRVAYCGRSSLDRFFIVHISFRFDHTAGTPRLE